MFIFFFYYLFAIVPVIIGYIIADSFEIKDKRIRLVPGGKEYRKAVDKLRRKSK